MDSLRNLFDSALGVVRERLLNPFYVAYFLAWSALNFRLILVLVSGGSAQEKIAYIDQALYPNWQTGMVRGLLIPFAAAVVYVVASPYVFRWVTLYHRREEKKTIEQVFAVLGETPMSKPQADRLRANLKEAKARYEQDLAEWRAEVDQLQDQLDRLQKGGNTAPSEAAKSESLQEASDGIDSPASADRVPAKEKSRLDRARLEASDFVGYPLDDYHRIVQRGIAIAHLAALYALRNEKAFSAKDLAIRLEVDDQFMLDGIVDELATLKVIEPVKTIENLSGRLPFVQYRMTKVGRLAVKLGLEAGHFGSP